MKWFIFRILLLLSISFARQIQLFVIEKAPVIMAHLQTKAFLLTRSALCADNPRSKGGFGFLRMKLVARFDLGVVLAGEEADAIAGGSCGRLLDFSSAPPPPEDNLALRESRVPLGVTPPGGRLIDGANGRRVGWLVRLVD